MCAARLRLLATWPAAVAALCLGLSAPTYAARPDLTVTALRATPRVVPAGGVVNVTAEVRNRGRARARRSRLRVSLSANRRSRAATAARTVAVGALRRRTHRTITTHIAVPRRSKPGSWFVRGCADARRRLREKSERNNCRATQVTVLRAGATPPGTPPGTTPPGTTPPSYAPPGDVQPHFPVRAIFYYPWFPGAWKQGGIYPYTHYNPTLGFYDSSARSVIEQHLQAMSYAGINVGISSWWGQGDKTDARVPDLLAATRATGSPVRWSIYYEAEAQGDPSAGAIESDLAYIRDRYGSDPAFFRVDGRFVVFVYADGGDACGMVDRWKQANAAIHAYVVLKVFPGYKSCAAQPDSWHQYSPVKSADSQAGYSYAISPGFYKAAEPTPQLARDPARFRQDVRNMVASNAPFQLVTTFNEWGEGTAVESAAEWASPSGYGDYLDALHNNGA
jgi:Glycosyl hydrolase family 99/CARDB